MAKSIPQHNIKKESQNIIHHLNNYEGKHDMTDSCTYTCEIGWDMEGSAAKIDYTTEFLSLKGVKLTIYLSNSDTIKIWACRNLLDSCDSPKILFSGLIVDLLLISPSWYFWDSKTFEYKFDCILTLANFSLQEIWKIPSRFFKNSALLRIYKFAAQMMILIWSSLSFWSSG